MSHNIFANVKLLDKLVVKGFIPPYIFAFLVAEFVLVMQFLWKYIDEIIGKGVSLGLILELIFYFAVTIIPMAIPVTILISSVLVFGNLSERHELSSFKSAGISLFRVMGAGIMIAILTGLFSFFASNYLRPNANYQFKYRWHSVKKAKTSLSIVEGVFNEDFKNFVIRVGNKDEDGVGIEDILIYDHTGQSNLINMVSAEDGEMYSSEDGSFFIMKLEDGSQYREDPSELNKEDKTRSYPLTETKFKEWTKIFDLSQFEMEALEINTDRQKYDLLNNWQLKKEIDSFDRRKNNILKDSYIKFPKIYPDQEQQPKAGLSSIKKADEKNVTTNKNSQKPTAANESNPKIPQKSRSSKTSKNLDRMDSIKKPDKSYSAKEKYVDTLQVVAGVPLIDQYIKDGATKKYVNTAHISAVRAKDHYSSKQRELKSIKAYRNVYQLRRHQQYSWAIVCVIFIFIGAPMGSIIRKGGYGYPLLIAIVFFMQFIVLNILGEKLNKNQSIHPLLAAWLPCIALLPFAIIITYKAVNDAKFELKNLNFLKKKS